MAGRKREPKLTPYHLIDGLQRWIVSSPDGPLHGKELMENFGVNYLEKQGLDLFIRVGGVEQILTFKASSLQPQKATKYIGNFSVHTIGVSGEHIDGLQKAIEARQTKLERGEQMEQGGHREPWIFSRRTYSRIFGTLRFEPWEVVFKEDNYKGVRVTITSIRIPLGHDGRLSDNLFIYAEKGIIKPIREFVASLEN